MSDKNASIRVRFAPAPTGMMHLGNVSTALLNFLFARQKGGTFIIRVEDTDFERNFDPKAEKIIEDLTWLGLTYDEGPGHEGPHAPYFQSQRTHIYKEKLDTLIDANLVYRCFCTPDELEKKRVRQVALKQPPRYDRACLKLNAQEIADAMAAQKPYIWRFKMEKEGSIEITDLTHGTITFEFKNFTDFPLTRADHTFTFIFANFVDDMVMQMTHVIRGEDHLTNTANQAALYKAFNTKLPTYWHLPILCNTEGKKLSKRDFGFSLRDLIAAGYLPEAICNYLAVIGRSFKNEIMSLQEIIETFNFDHMHSTGHIKYDVEKLTWTNHKWISQYNDAALADLCKPFLQKELPEIYMVKQEIIVKLIRFVKSEMQTLQDASKLLSFYCKAPTITHADLAPHMKAESITILSNIVAHTMNEIVNPQGFVQLLKDAAAAQNIPMKEVFTFVRMALMGSAKGPAIHELIEMLGAQEARARLEKVIA